MENLNELSPTAQAIEYAYFNADGFGYRAGLAAALRAIAERNEYKANLRDEMEVMFSEGWNGLRKEILSIADELEDSV
jgi:hypothetical protein